MESRVGTERIAMYTGDELPFALEACPMLLAELRKVIPARVVSRIQVYDAEVIFDTDFGGKVSFSWKKEGKVTSVSVYDYDEEADGYPKILYSSEYGDKSIIFGILLEFRQLRWNISTYVMVLSECRRDLLSPLERFIPFNSYEDKIRGFLSNLQVTTTVLAQEGFRDSSYKVVIWDVESHLAVGLIAVDPDTGRYIMIRRFRDGKKFDFLIYSEKEGPIEDRYVSCFVDLSTEFGYLTAVTHGRQRSL